MSDVRRREFIAPVGSLAAAWPFIARAAGKRPRVAVLDNRRVQIVTLATHHRLPTIYSFRENVEIGGLMSYGSSAADRDRPVGVYAGRILKGRNRPSCQ
jgi:hypothetical protein